MQQQVTALKFRSLTEDEQWRPNPNNSGDQNTIDSRQAVTHTFNQPESITTLTRRSKTENNNNNNNKSFPDYDANFLLKSSRPALVFDQVCFHVPTHSRSPLASFIPDPSRWCDGAESDEERPQQVVRILKSIKLTVPQGSIFGLLGPSSCGKTTLLRCLVGLLNPTSGSIQFSPSLASRPGRGGPEIPGPDVGYMPQELALYEDFSIEELLGMYGQYVGMSDETITRQVHFLAGFLELPEVSREIATLSGGQKRRVSLAIALLHSPSLIILDEPTVGVDPLLRKSIWKYLRRLANEQGRTIVITTHYIEEAGQADQVALMRQGQILVQGPPAAIMATNKCATLEEAFLKICSQAEAKSKDKLKPNSAKVQTKQSLIGASGWITSPAKQWAWAASSLKIHSDQLSIDPLPVPDSAWCEGQFGYLHNQTEMKLEKSDDNEKTSDKYKRPKSQRTTSESISRHLLVLWAVMYKNYRRNLNSWPLLAFQFLLPVIQMVSFSLCVGGRPTNVGLGLVNLDFGSSSSTTLQSNPLDSAAALIASSKPTAYSLVTENITTIMITTQPPADSELAESDAEEPLSMSYLARLDREMLDVRPYATLEAALLDVKSTKLWAAMEIGPNFTAATLSRFDSSELNLENANLDDDNNSLSDSSLGGPLNRNTIYQSTIRLYPDRSNRILDSLCLRSLSQSYRQFLADQFVQFRRLPIELREPVFDIAPNLISNSIQGYTESIAAGLLASLTYIMAAGLTTFIMVLERSLGVLERTYATGVSPVVFLLAHAVFRSVVMMVQVALVLVLTFYVIRQPLEGSLWLAYAMLMWLNLSGIAFGLLVSSLVTEQNGAALAIVSSLVVKLTLSGILWPLEAVPYALRWLAWLQPLTLPVQALKLITLKGATLADPNVALAFLSTGIWLTVFLVVSSKCFRFYQH